MNVGSTRGGVADLPLADALLRGTAPDGGLFVPARLPRGEVRAPGGGALADAAVAVLAPFFAGDRLAPELPTMVAEAFTFPAPLVPLRGPGDFVVELFHGPTAAFKDFGARFLAACVRAAPSGRRRNANGAGRDVGRHRRRGRRGLPPDGRRPGGAALPRGPGLAPPGAPARHVR